MLWAASLTRNLSIETVVSAMLRCSLLRSHRSSSSSIIFALFICNSEEFVEDSFPMSYISCNLDRIPFTVSNEKTASCKSSAEISIAKRIASAVCSLMASRSGIIFPSDFDIFLPSIKTEPFTTICFGQFFLSKIATWLKIKNDKWFGTRSLPECLESTG